jgi:holliday junction DNA helicase RuvA
MYQYLNGQLAEKSPAKIVLDVNGVGYEIRIPVSTYSKLPALGEKVKLLIHFHVREDLQVLYGFFTEEEREMFRLLISVSGIGPKIAMTVLSGVSLRDLKQAIIQGALPALTSVSGIGKKIAERMVVELREKVVLEDAPSAEVSSEFKEAGPVVEDSLQALVELGYKKPSAKAALEKALKDFKGEKPSAADLIRKSLKYV